MGLLARHRGPDPEAPWRERGGCDRHCGPEMDRTAARYRGRQGGLLGQRWRDQGGAAGLCLQRRDLALCGPGSDRVRPGAAQNQRRQARQEAPARAVRTIARPHTYQASFGQPRPARGQSSRVRWKRARTSATWPSRSSTFHVVTSIGGSAHTRTVPGRNSSEPRAITS